jgi:hypothetical protein
MESLERRLRGVGIHSKEAHDGLVAPTTFILEACRFIFERQFRFHSSDGRR